MMAASGASIVGALTGLISSILFFTVVILLILWGMRRSRNNLPAGLQVDLELERRRAGMAEAEVRALRSANLELHLEVDRLRHQLGQVEQS